MSSQPSSATSERFLSIGDVVSLYGVSFDQLRYWDRKGILVPQRVGARRVYLREHLLRLAHILQRMKQGWSPLKIAIWYEFQGTKKTKSLSTTAALEHRLRRAVKGDVIREPLPTKAAYNTVFVRLARKIRQLFPEKKVGRGKDVEIRLSEDERFLEAHFLK